ncbi:MFS transporter [Nocardioides sp. WS12]|uniref:MFS transporter n=1 Tax=Nocardioides sp. WS12 TaxID=2486272 RepID=UPI0015FA36F2|nr:MFS transporter [Nocardioides sp. WS12]
MKPAAVAARPAQVTVPVWALAALMTVIGLNLRASLGSVPPLLDDITRDLELSGLEQGLLTSLVVAFMGIGAPVGHRVAVRVGAVNGMGVGLAVLSLGCLLRLVPAGAPLLLCSCAIVGAGMGAASALVPSLIASHLSRIRGLAVGLYTTGTAVGVALAAWIATPVEESLGGWRPALAFWGVIAAVTALVWVATARRLPADPPPEGRVERRLPWRSPTAWWITWFTASAMLIGFSGLAWVTPLFLHLGTSEHHAAGLFAVFQLVGPVSMVAVSWLTDVVVDRRPLLAVVITASTTGVLFLLVAPLTLAVPSMVLFGIGAGGCSTLALVLLVDVTRTQADATRLGAMVILIAYLVGATGPALLGILREATGGFTAGYAVLLAIGILSLLSVPMFGPQRRL